MTLSSREPGFILPYIAFFALLVPAAGAVHGQSRRLLSAAKAPAAQPAPNDRASAYYHYGLAHLYEDLAVNAGRPDYATQAVEEYKLALGADPNSRLLQDGLADLYFKIGRIREAVTAAQEQVARNPQDIQAHLLLGKVYLRSLGDMQGPQSGEVLQLAIAEYEKITTLKPADIESHLLLGQLYGFNHDSQKAEAEFKKAQALDSGSEEVVLNMVRLYTEQANPQRAMQTLTAVPEADRTAREQFALGATYDMLHRPADAVTAYRHALEDDAENLDGQRGLANALLANGQLDEALKTFNLIVAAEPQDAQTQIHISEVQRKQGHYALALATLQKAKALTQDNLELSYNEALIYDSMGRFEDAINTLKTLIASTSHPDGKYSEQEKSNRTAFLDRLGIIYREQSKTSDAVAAYKQIGTFGGEYLSRGAQGQIDAYRDAHQWKEATATAAELAHALPKDRTVQLAYAGQLADTGKSQEGIALALAQLDGSATDREVHVALANIYTRLSRWNEAAAELDKADKTATKPEEKLYNAFLRGTMLDRRKMYPQAEAEFRKALVFDPQNSTVLNYLGYMLAERGEKLPEALTLIQKAIELDPQNGAYLDSLGWVYFKMGQYTAASDALRKAIERIGTDPTVHDHLGQVYEKTGKLKLAVAQWERSMSEYAHSLPADADPADVQKVQHELESARVKLARVSSAQEK